MIFKHWNENKCKEQPDGEKTKIYLEEPADIDQKEPEIAKGKRRVINGKLYDTSKAELVFRKKIYLHELGYDCFPASFPASWRDYLFETIDLYKGRNEWFCVVREEMLLLTEKQARNLLGKYDVDKYIEFFGEPELA